MSDALSQDDIEALLSAAASHGDDGDAGDAAAPPPAAAARPAGEAPQRNVRTMDFARPAKFSKDQLRTLHMLHESFCRRASTMLSGSVRSLVEVSVTGTEQLPYGDYVSELPVPTFTAVLEVHPLGTNAMVSIDLPLLFAIVDRMLGGPGTNVTRVRELTEIETGLAANLAERLLVELGGAWSDLVPLEFRMRGIEMNAQFAQIVPASEPSVLIQMDVSIGTATGSIALCLPFRSIEDVVGDLTAHRYFSHGDDDDAGDDDGTLLAGIQNVRVPVRVEAGATRLPVDRVLGMQAGDVIPLGRHVDDGVTLAVGNARAWTGIPGQADGRVAVRVTGRDQAALPAPPPRRPGGGT